MTQVTARSGRNKSTRRVALTDVLTGSRPAWLVKYPRQASKTFRRHESIARVRDVTLVILLAALWLPIVGIIALTIKIQDRSAPVLFRQTRTGRDGQLIEILKFRTMVKEAESMKHDLLHLNELQWPDFKISNDPRITRIGKVMRMTSLDELPQLFNVLKGDMGLVGPRPTSFGVETYDSWHTARLDLRPGLTGLWQVAARADLEWNERVRLELAYADRACSALDMEILLRTVGAVLSKSGS